MSKVPLRLYTPYDLRPHTAMSEKRRKRHAGSETEAGLARTAEQKVGMARQKTYTLGAAIKVPSPWVPMTPLPPK
jgi:hypothetical protein